LRRAFLASLPLLVVQVTALRAQNDAKGPPTPVARIVKGPETGQRAPDFTLPWVNRQLAGAEDQPFRLTDNLGKVVIIAFFQSVSTPGGLAELNALSAVADSVGTSVTVVAISADSSDVQHRTAVSLNLPYLLLSDVDQRVARRYGSDGPQGMDRATAYVIKPDGKVAFRDLSLEVQDPKEYDAIRKAAVKAGQP
jgi:peroxiredoxin